MHLPLTESPVQLLPIDMERTVDEVIRQAQRDHLRLVTDGRRFVLCSVIPPGFRTFEPRERVRPRKSSTPC